MVQRSRFLALVGGTGGAGGGEPGFCGDGIVQPGEGCDDGNTTGGDSCPASCVFSVIQVELGVASACALFDDGRVKCWGGNSHGQLGLGDTEARGDNPGEMGDNVPVVDLGAGNIAVALSKSAFHTCALLVGGRVKCWGRNYYGALGLGDTKARGDAPGEMGDNLPVIDLGTGKVAIAVSAGGNHSCALLSDGSVKCWGWNDFGLLGLGDISFRGDNPNEMGDNLPTVDLGTGKIATALAASAGRTCALLNDGSVKCWGNNELGGLGLGDQEHRGYLPSQMGDNLPTVDLGTGKTAKKLSSNSHHTCALLSDGGIKCWGANLFGQLGLGDMATRGDEPNEMGDNLPAVDLGAGKLAIDLSVGGSHTCAILQDQSVKCWGMNTIGQLGHFDPNNWNVGDQPGEMGDNLPVVDLGTGALVSAISANHDATCVLLNDSRMKCWGDNENGRLGLGDTDDRGDNPGELGDNLPFVAP